MWGASLVFVTIFFVVLAIPCIGIGWLGWRTINKLGQFPSKTPAIQTGILLKLIIIEIVSVALLLMFYKILQ